MKMKKSIKVLLVFLAAIVCTIEASAQQISAAVADQHYAAQTSKYKLMMLALAGVYAVYMVLNLRRKREMNRFLGKQ